nr:hypothetical protein [Petrachloros mirabilis]
MGTYLVEAGLLSEAQVGVILADQGVISLPFGEIVATRGWLKQETIEYLMDKVVLPERRTSVLAPESDLGHPQSIPVSQPQNVTELPVSRHGATRLKDSSNLGHIQSFAQEPTPTAEDESISWIG